MSPLQKCVRVMRGTERALTQALPSIVCGLCLHVLVIHSSVDNIACCSYLRFCFPNDLIEVVVMTNVILLNFYY